MSFLRNSGFLPRIRPLSRKRPSIVTVLDIGTSKLCCLIARLTPRHESDILPGRTHEIEVLGIGHQRSRGIKCGKVDDVAAAEQAIRRCVDAAEKMADVTVDSLIVNVSSGRIASEAFTANVSLGGNEVEAADIVRVLNAGAEATLTSERTVIHSIPIGYSLDGDAGIRDPRAMFGDSLGVNMHVVSSEHGPLRNLELAVNKGHLSVEGMVATPYASGLAALVEDEAEMGCACIDMGGGTTTISIFIEGRFVYTDALTLGGIHVTNDIARGLSTRIDDAEKLKVRHGSALAGTADDHDIIMVPPIGEDERDLPYQVSKAQLTRIIRPRIEETLEMLRDRLNRSGFAGAVGKRLVLTGGGAQMTGVAEVARRILARNVRIGRPMGARGLPEARKGPAFSTAVGLLIYPQHAEIESFATHRPTVLSRSSAGGAFGRVGRWLKESF